MVDDKLAVDEANRAENYEAVKGEVNANVAHQVRSAAVHAAPSGGANVNTIGEELRASAADEIAQTHGEVQRARTVARVSQIIDYLFFIVYGLLTVRLLLELFAARESAAFFKFIKSATGPFYAPFSGLVPSPTTAEGFTLALPIIVAIVVYMLLHLAINGLLRIFAHRKTTI